MFNVINVNFHMNYRYFLFSEKKNKRIKNTTEIIYNVFEIQSFQSLIYGWPSFKRSFSQLRPIIN